MAKKSRAKNYSNSGFASKGFTLLEVLIVVSLLATITMLAMPRIRKNTNNIKSSVRELTVLSREVRHYARLKNSTYRIVFNMTGKEDSYYVEAAGGSVLIKSETKQKLEASMSAKDRPSSGFNKVDRPLKKEKKLPPGITFKSVENKGRERPITTGTAYVHFSPEGLVEQSIVQLTDGKDMTWSLIFNPLTGHADIVNKAMTLKDLESQ